MTSQQLEQGRKINDELISWERLVDHLKTFKNKDSVEEVKELLNGYRNLMSSFNRKEIAEIMINSIYIHSIEKVKELQKQLDEL